VAKPLLAEQQCRKIKARSYGWTPKQSNAIQAVLYWKGIEKCQTMETVGKNMLKH